MAKRIQVGGRIECKEVGGIVTGAAEILDDAKGKKQSVINGETEDELLRLDQSKQDNLTFDNAPTEGSNNPVKSGGVYAADKALSDAIEAILLLIPSAASALNKLVDTSMMNSSISTATATFRGTYNVVTDLSLTVDATHEQIAAALGNAISTADNNDYVFVQIPVSEESTDIRRTERYKFNGTAWGYEYDLNTSGFTAAQWAAINSGITLALVGKMIGLPTSSELQALLGQKQDTLTFDNIPVSGSANPVKSGGVYSAINDEKTAREQLANTVTGIDGRVENIEEVIPTGAAANNKLVANNSMEAYVTSIIEAITASFTIATADGHINLTLTQTNGRVASITLTSSDIASAQALTALTGRVSTAESNITTLGGRVSTNETDIANLQQLYNDLQQSKPEPVTALPETGQQQGVIYRLAGTTSYSDYMWNGSTWVLMATYNNAIDPRPKKASQNLVTSGGVFDNMGALDVSELNATENPHTLAQYVDLSAALAAIPTDYKKGGMSIKFVQSSDNKYIQARCMAQNFTTDITQWQGVDDEPTAGSSNLVESGGTAVSIQKITGVIDKEFNLAVGETPSARTKTPCFFKSGDKVVGHVTDGTAVFDTEVTKQLVITFYRADGTTLISHSAIDAYTFTLSENAYFYALYAYKVITAGTVNVSLESTSSLDNITEKVLNQETVINPELRGLINNVSFHSGEKLNIVDIENEVKENSAKLPKSGAVYASVDNNYKKEDLYRFAQLGVVSRYINITSREHSSTKDKVWVPITAGIYYVKVDLVTAVIGNNPSVSFHIFNDTTDKRSIPITLGEEKKITVSASEEGNSFGIYLYPVETFGDIFVSFKKEYNIPDDLKDVDDAIKEAQADIFKLKAETLDLSAEKSYADSLFPVQYDSLSLVAKTGQILTVKVSTTGSLGYGWRLYGKKADGTYTKLVERWSASENTITINEDYIDIATYIAGGTNSGTATFNVKVENWHSDTDEALISIETNVGNLQTDVNKLKLGEIFIPSYFETQVASVIEKATSDIADAAINGDNFIFITDMHWENNSKKSPALIQRLCNEMTISKVIFGGDAINGQANKATAMSYFNAIAKGLKKAVSNFFSVLGNHDWNSQSGGSRFNTDGGVFYALLQKHSDFKMKYGSVAYFYFDDETTNTRYICIDSGPGLSFTSTQGDWIRSVLANTDNDMHIIFVIHGYMNMTAYQEGGEFAGYDYALSQAGTALNNIITNHISTKKIEAVISGHTHLDYNGMTSAMVPVIVTDCDALSTQEPTHERGTITEQAFDVITINYAMKLISCRRVGRGKSRLIHYTPYTMNVGETLDISQLLSIVPTDYSVRDNMVFEYRESSGISFYDNNATISNAGVVTAVASGYLTAVAENDDCIETFNIKIN